MASSNKVTLPSGLKGQEVYMVSIMGIASMVWGICFIFGFRTLRVMASSKEATLNSSYCWEDAENGLEFRILNYFDWPCLGLWRL